MFDDSKRTHADPVMVDHILKSVGNALTAAMIPHATTPADLLSAIFTILYRLLKTTRESEDAADHEGNAKEIDRILMDLLAEFGSRTPVH